ncbi:hypothetical protein ACFFRR_007171 [Megaselia abdita]
MMKIVVYIFAVSSMALAAHIKIINIEDLGKEQPLKTEYFDYDDFEFMSDDDGYHFDSNGTFLSFNDDDQSKNDASEIIDDNDGNNEYNDDGDNENEEDIEEYDSFEDPLKPYGALNHVKKEDLQPYGALNYKQHQYQNNENLDQSAELYENSEEELLIVKRTTTPRPLREPRPPTNPFRLRLQRFFSNRRVVFLK